MLVTLPDISLPMEMPWPWPKIMLRICEGYVRESRHATFLCRIFSGSRQTIAHRNVVCWDAHSTAVFVLARLDGDTVICSGIHYGRGMFSANRCPGIAWARQRQNLKRVHTAGRNEAVVNVHILAAIGINAVCEERQKR
jgi:hypothetical protein